MRREEIPCYLGYIAIIVGTIVAFGWVAGIPLLQSPFPDLPTMSFFTAIAVILGGIMLCAFTRRDAPEKTENIELVMWLCMVVLVMVALPQIATSVFGVHSGVEDFFSPREIKGKLYNPAIPSFGTVIGMIFLVIISIFSIYSRRTYSRIITAAGLMLVGLASIAALGLVLGEPSLYFVSARSAGMSIRTTVVFFLLGTGFIYANHLKRTAASAPSQKQGGNP